MPNDFLSSYQFLNLPDHLQRQGVDFLLGRGRPPAGLERLAYVTDPLARLDLLAQALLTPYKDHARAGSRREPGGLSELYRSQAFQAALEDRKWQLEILGLLPGLPDLTILPGYSFAMHFAFTLRTAYLSKDDVGLHILDNPVRKDKVFGLPMVGPASWKGSLRAALWQLGHRHDGKEHKNEQIQRLFGDTHDDDTGQSGCLTFYPTFFTRLGLEVINPHDRQSNAGKQPIYFECVPAGAQGEFTLLYVPGNEVDRNQVLADLRLAVEGIEAMLMRYGFGAKTSNGFGLAQEAVSDGSLTLRIVGLHAPPPPPEVRSAPDHDLPRYLEAPGQLKSEFRTADGSFRYRSETELKAMKKADQQLYDKARVWWEREGRTQAESAAKLKPKPPAAPALPTPTWPTWQFAAFDELLALAERVAQQFSEGGVA
ncbi:MAG: hypothetical protein K1X65_22850 [Caldilineales bacterium]|nr:hypothetical protein [Caldilineales bacterium]